MAIRRRTLLALVLALAALSFATRSLWLPQIALFLIQAGEPVHADAIIVLAGDGYGHRILRGAELATSGYAPTVYVSGPAPYYEQNEADLAIALATRHGYPPSLFEAVRYPADSTREEAEGFLRFLNSRGFHKVLLVTSDFHTRRAGRIFRRTAPGIEFHVVASSTEFLTPDQWWTTRPGRKIIFMEWTKTLADWLGI